MFRTAFVRIAPLMVLAPIAACSDALAPRGQLSSAESQAVASALFVEAVASMDQASADNAPLLNASAAQGSSATFTVSRPCVRGGRMNGVFTYEDNFDANRTGTATATLTLAPEGCVVRANERREIAINGAPNVKYTFTQSMTQGEPSSAFVATALGAISWEGGSCEVNYTITANLDGTGTVKGQFCRTTVDGSWTGGRPRMPRR